MKKARGLLPRCAISSLETSTSARKRTGGFRWLGSKRVQIGSCRGQEGRDVDYWQTYSFGDLSATAQTRKAVLERIVPRLAIGSRCSFEDKFLVVEGKLRTYKIHLGSGNILMKPNDEYLCIVPSRGEAAAGDKVFLPFEGDRTLSIVLSKALLLAADDKISDPTITRQIGRI